MQKIINSIANKVGIYTENISSGKKYLLNHQLIFPAASVIKLSIMYAAFQKIRQHELQLSDKISYAPGDYVDDSPWFLDKREKAGNYTVYEIIHAMITVSDNTSTNLLIDFLGFDYINMIHQKLGMNQTILNRKMCDFRAREAGKENLSSPADIAVFFKELLKLSDNQVIRPAQIKTISNKIETDNQAALTMLKILSEQKDLEKIPTGLASEDLIIANKPGELPGIRHDAALLISPISNYILIIFTQDVFDENKADNQLAELSKLLYLKIS